MTQMPDPRTFLRSLFDTAVASVLPSAQSIARYLPPPPKGRTVVVGAGKGAAAMAKAVEDVWQGPLSGLVVTRYDHGCPTRFVEVIEAGHPNPDAASQDAARRIMAMAGELTEDDLLLCLISGGGSALMVLPAPDLSLDDKKAVTRELLRSGAAIDEMNVVRKHLSAIKGGRLAAMASPAPVVTLMISDVPDDNPSIIASGPTVPDPSTFADARAVIAKYGITLPEAVRRHLDAEADETPKPGDARLSRASHSLIAIPQTALDAAADLARAAGVTPLILGDAIEGESREVARVMAGMAKQAALRGQPLPAPCVILSGGETTVTVRGNGRGGRNAEFLLSLAVALNGRDKVWAIACDTDGIDGTEDNAGALLGPDSLSRAAALGVDAKALLANNDGYTFFSKLGDLVVTGPTRTNVNDFRAILILP